jgi:type II restriction/modification system DNA methylase subunit YeeA
MVDESLLVYLEKKTAVDEQKLRAIISYDLEDDLSNPISDSEQSEVIESLSTIKILDPACGSGAFPIGALQKNSLHPSANRSGWEEVV